ncbi:hypothetical protein C3F00_034860 [Pseudomonas sp. MWU13-2860]|nr:hypothetical protein C3F00_034860 [Pseudomonas sp. MWU13-2860]
MLLAYNLGRILSYALAGLLLGLAGEWEGRGRDEDALAFLRDVPEYRNLTLAELPNGDFGQTVLRIALFSGYQVALWQALRSGGDARLAAIADKALAESPEHDVLRETMHRLGARR